MSQYIRQLYALARVTSVRLPATFTYHGTSFNVASHTRGTLPAELTRPLLVESLSHHLYRHYYALGSAKFRPLQLPLEPTSPLPPFKAALSAANCGTGPWDAGWEVRELAADSVALCKSGMELWAPLSRFTVTESEDLRPGVHGSLRLSNERLSTSPGFYVALGNRVPDMDFTHTLVRLYWNISPAGAARFVRAATTILNDRGVGFQLKILNHPLLFTRCDAVVVYLRKEEFEFASEGVRRLYDEVEEFLAPGIPALTKPLMPGVALAEDPGTGDSFGEHRCRIIADALVVAGERGLRTVRDRFGLISAGFTDAGLSLARPFLNPGSCDTYTVRALERSTPNRSTRFASRPRNSDDIGSPLSTAESVARRLYDMAVWHRNRCNWIGPSARIHYAATGADSQYSALGPDLYSGTSGMALFFAQFFDATGERQARITALGAIRQALHSIDRISPDNRTGLYTGVLGIAFAAARIGQMFNEAWLLEEAARLAQCAGWEQAPDSDLLSGQAGAIVGLLTLAAMLRDRTCVHHAIAVGDNLIDRAISSGAGYSWISRTPATRNLIGLAHGASGIGLALLELFRATGAVAYRAAGLLAFAYERQWFNRVAHNWPDFRFVPGSSRRSKRPFFTVAWCHGAPGIAVARARAYELLQDRVCQAEARVALKATRSSIEDAIASKQPDLSTCHGLPGLTEVAQYVAEVLGCTSAQTTQLCALASRAAMERHRETIVAFDWGAGEYEKGLMVGLAGFGYFCLRMHDSRVPSILVIRPEAHAKMQAG